MRQQLKAVNPKQLTRIEAELKLERFESVAGNDDVNGDSDQQDFLAFDILNALPDNFFRWASVGTFLSVFTDPGLF